MRAVFAIVTITGIGLAGFAAYKTQQYVSRSQEAERAALRQIVPTVEVYVVAKELEFGHRLTREDVVRIAWPKHAVPENAFLTEGTLFPEGDARPRIVIRPMERFEPLLVSKVTEPGGDAGLTTRLNQGMRAFAINVDLSSGVSGFLRPGDRVDVYWTGNTQGLEDYSEREVTRLIESAVKIVAVDQKSEIAVTDTTLARTVTVEASPQQVARLAQAQATGRLALSLVGTGDIAESGPVVEVNRRDLLGMEERVQGEVVQEKVCTVRTRRGAEVVEIPIPCTN
jgi:pilus assembly protein CpaB